jgi:iron(III) transport system permease protein
MTAPEPRPTPRVAATQERRVIASWTAVGGIGFALLPWYALRASILSVEGLREAFARESAPALVQALAQGRLWLLPIALALVAALLATGRRIDRRTRSRILLVAGSAGLLYTLIQGFAIGPRGLRSPFADGFATTFAGQPGLGLGAAIVMTAFVMLFAIGLALRGRFKGDAFIAGSVVSIAVLVTLFTFFPVTKILLSAIQGQDGTVSIAAFVARLAADKLWGFACLVSNARCGVVWNTIALATACAIICTSLGLAFALLVTRTTSRVRGWLRIVSILPIITPPFVIGLGLMLIFGRSGLVNQALESILGIEPTRWIYGFQGILLAQVFAFTPIAFLVLAGVVDGVSPSLEEAAQTLRADRWTTFTTVSLPLIRPGLANAFLISFIESIADFGNPILLGGNFGVLSTEIFFSVVGAQLDQGRAATLGIVLLSLALGAFVLQRQVVGKRVYTTMSGKGDGGLPMPLPRRVRFACLGVAVPWALLTLSIYAMALAGGFVRTWGRDYTFTLEHYAKAFAVEWGPRGILWAGAAWSSFWTTVQLSAVAAPLTAALGILTAWILTRQRFAGQGAFEFGTMLSFAIPGTVIGVSYILAFNVPPFELTGTAIILVACNVFRNMPVGVRAGMASMAQIDRSLDEAAHTLGARGWTTLRTVVLPLLKPAIVAALVYSFVRAMTTLSAVIFLVSAQYEWATTYIINRVVNGDYGIAIAYSSVLIVLMVIVILAIQWLVGERRLGRRQVVATRDVAPLGRLAA